MSYTTIPCKRVDRYYFELWCYIQCMGEAKNHQRTGKYEYTSLMGADKKKVLERLENLPNILHPETVSTVQKLWVDFQRPYSFLTSAHPDARKILSGCTKWIDTFVSLSHSRRLYKRTNVTPYVHIMACHVPELIKKYKSLKMFSGQSP